MEDDWFHDFDTRTKHLVEIAQRDPSQAAPAFCGIASESQKKLIANTLRKMYDAMQAQELQPQSSADNALDWFLFVLPYLESTWACGQQELASGTVESICDRIYPRMDRHSIAMTKGEGAVHPKLGWP